MSKNFFRNLQHNIGVLVVGLVVGYMGALIDNALQLEVFTFPFSWHVGLMLTCVGFLIRVWATHYFYKNQMKVISLKPQSTLLTTGPYKYSRNPLYIGGNVFIFSGASLVAGSLSALILTTIGIFLTDFMIRKEEKQLEKKFGNDWIAYKNKVRRWL